MDRLAKGIPCSSTQSKHLQGSDVDKSDDFAFHRIELRAPERFASPHGRSSQMSRPGQTSVIIKCTYEYRLVKRFCLSEQARTSRCRFIFSDQPSGNWRAPKPVLESSPILKFRPPSFTVLVMTRDALIALFDSTDSMEAGAVISFVMSLAYDDIRFETSFEGRANTAIGYWLAEKAASVGEFFTITNPLSWYRNR